ncbi:unnamed protein product [Hapterophycus canaliculatus]
MQEPSTRLIVKNVPKHVDEKRLRQHFAERGEVSDAKIVRTKDGKSRQFAFVGFTTAGDAEDALKYYNQTFLDTSRIQVERAQPKGNASIARPWSKHSEGSSRAQKLAEAKAKKEGKAKDMKSKSKNTSDEKAVAAAASARGKVEKEEFMAALKKRSEARFWDNDDAMLDQSEAAAAPPGSEDGSSSDVASSEDGAGVDNEEVSDGSEDETETRQEKTRQSNRSSSGGDRRNPGSVSDMDWLRSKVGGEGGDAKDDQDDQAVGSESGRESDSEEESGGEEGGDGKGAFKKEGQNSPKGGASGKGAKRKEQSSAQEGGGDESNGIEEDEEEEKSGRLFVRNLPYTSTEDDLRELFGRFGMLSEVHLPVDDVKKGKGFAFVQFVIPEDAEKALEQLDRHAFHGRLLHILPARRQPGSSGAVIGKAGSAATAGKGYKEQKELERRARAGDSVGWNASFVRSDTVVDALADRLGVGKGDILDREEVNLRAELPSKVVK